LFGCFDIAKNLKGDFVAEVTDPLTPAMLKFKAKLLESGLFTMMRGHTVFCNPPLIIQPDEIEKAFDIFDEALAIMDEALE
jgi:adenosylmethionine-8-amino-7-oxononanoate aminotransferase